MTNLDLLNALFGEMAEFEPASYYSPLELAMISLYCEAKAEERYKILFTLTKCYRKEQESIGLDVLNAFHAIETFRYYDTALFLSALKGLQDEKAD